MRDILWRMAGFTTEPPMAQTVVMGTVRRVWRVVAMLAAGSLWGAEGPSGCAGGGYGALSFWVGNWKVSDPGGNELGRSKIELRWEGAGLRRPWGPGGGF